MSRNVAVIGSGGWGLALANHIAEKGNNVKVWSFTKEEKDYLNSRHRSIYLPNTKINENVVCSNDLKETIEGTDMILHVSPSRFTRSIFRSYKDYVGDKPVVICSKGFEDESLTTLDGVMKEELPNVKICALSGPSFANEVANRIPTAVILASEDEKLLDDLAEFFSNEYMRVYKSKDVKGVEVGGALKNIMAFCAGACAELDYGTNAQAALMTRGLAEIARLGIKMGANNETFYGLSGLGDLILTCSSDESRNRRAGKLIAKGLSMDETRNKIAATIESFDNIQVAKKLSEKYDVEMPIVDAAYDVVFNGVDVREAGKRLMTRQLKFENE